MGSAPSSLGSSSTAEDVTAGLDLHSKTVLVTGATSGLGMETSRVLAKRGAHVILAVRNTKKGEEVKAKILESTPTALLDVLELDLNSLSAVRKFAADFKSRNFPLNILINNAGVVLGNFQQSEDGLEKTFATNHIGSFLLTNLLLDTLKATAKETGEQGRIVILSSEAHKHTYKEGIRFDTLNDEKSYKAWAAYGQSKLANILHAKELAQRLQEEGANVTANSLHPGVIVTNFGKGQLAVLNPVTMNILRLFTKSVSQGAATTCYVATHPDVEGVSGKYFRDCKENNNMSEKAKDGELAAQLWQYSEEFVASH